MYEEYWKLDGKPFEDTPDPEFLYLSVERSEALHRFVYPTTERKGAGSLTGEYG
ncbi:MAG: hypothetical protein R3199_05845 [Gemmatimonadota bacterium]|nr:hypothetical protein [Gemmatimonadota bacterium]